MLGSSVLIAEPELISIKRMNHEPTIMARPLAFFFKPYTFTSTELELELGTQLGLVASSRSIFRCLAYDLSPLTLTANELKLVVGFWDR